MVKICRNNQCIYENECWFRHENDNSKLNNIKTNENEKLIEKLVGLVEKLNERVLTLEKKRIIQNEIKNGEQNNSSKNKLHEKMT